MLVGDLLVFEDVKRAVQGVDYMFFTFAVQDGLLDATTIAAMAASEAGVASYASHNDLLFRISPECAHLHCWLWMTGQRAPKALFWHDMGHHRDKAAASHDLRDVAGCVGSATACWEGICGSTLLAIEPQGSNASSFLYNCRPQGHCQQQPVVPRHGQPQPAVAPARHVRSHL